MQLAAGFVIRWSDWCSAAVPPFFLHTTAPAPSQALVAAVAMSRPMWAAAFLLLAAAGAHAASTITVSGQQMTFDNSLDLRCAAEYQRRRGRCRLPAGALHPRSGWCRC